MGDAGDVESILLSGRPLLDVRSPIEFKDGSAPGAVNLPLLSDDERHVIGLRYKQEGQDAAIRLGEELVSGQKREELIDRWAQFVGAHPDAVVYCFRGGLRSQSVARVLREERGLRVPIVEGGYKAIRRCLLNVMEARSRSESFVVLTGRTGTGKTDALRALSSSRRVLDMEGHANHRGSAFGRRPEDQPRAADFENRMALELLRFSRAPERGPVVLEDESRMIGALTLPLCLFERIIDSPLVVIEEPMRERVDLLLRFYLNADYDVSDAESAIRAVPVLGDDLRRNFRALEKRLGGVRFQQGFGMLEDALQVQAKTGSWAGHAGWIEFLLREYYDPLYDRHINAQANRVVFRGTRAAAVEFLLGST